MTVFSSDNMAGRLPPKKSGRHRFVAIATFAISEEAARGAELRTDPAILDHENLWSVNVGCIDCEEPWELTMKNFCDAAEYRG